MKDKIWKEYSNKSGDDYCNVNEEKGEGHGTDKGFYGHMEINKLKTNHKKSKLKSQRNF